MIGPKNWAVIVISENTIIDETMISINRCKRYTKLFLLLRPISLKIVISFWCLRKNPEYKYIRPTDLKRMKQEKPMIRSL